MLTADQAPLIHPPTARRLPVGSTSLSTSAVQTRGGALRRQFQELDPNLPVRLAVNPDFPFAHFVGAEVVVRDGTAYIADDGQENYLPVGARDALTWA